MVATNGTSHTTTEYEGVAQRVNERGILFAGRTTWTNVSKFAGAVDLPAAGRRVRVTLDGAGFIRACTLLGDEPEYCEQCGRRCSDRRPCPCHEAPVGCDCAGCFPDDYADTVTHPATAPAQPATPDRETTITRLAVLKAAAQFCQYRPDVTAADVLAIASEWEGWVTR